MNKNVRVSYLLLIKASENFNWMLKGNTIQAVENKVLLQCTMYIVHFTLVFYLSCIVLPSWKREETKWTENPTRGRIKINNKQCITDYITYRELQACSLWSQRGCLRRRQGLCHRTDFRFPMKTYHHVNRRGWVVILAQNLHENQMRKQDQPTH